MRVWIDIDNPPQVQYLVPLARAFESQGDDVVITARDNGMTLGLLRHASVDFHAIGSSFGRSRTAKLQGVVGRGAALFSFFRGHGRPHAVISSSRSSAIAACWMRIPSFILCDYEFVDLRAYRFVGATIAFPDVIEASVFRRQGFRDRRLIPFRGLKEDISFTGVPIADIQPHVFPQITAPETVRVLFRPPAEESHYYVQRSGSVAARLLEYLATRGDCLVVFAPRYDWQAEPVMSLDWRNQPVILTEPVPFIPLLTACDLVISSGGTMLREAAYLGIPAYSAFGGERGQVDLFLASIGRLRYVDADFSSIALEKRGLGAPLDSNPDLATELVLTIRERAS